jgi:hypothetical protein
MDRQKLTKRFTVFAVIISSVAFLGTSAVGLWQLAQEPAPIRLPSNSAQAESQANSALEILRKKPQDANANKSLELVFRYHANQRNIPKLIQILEKQQQVAPNIPNASQYKEALAQLKAPASPSSSPSAKAAEKKANNTPAASPGKPSDK